MQACNADQHRPHATSHCFSAVIYAQYSEPNPSVNRTVPRLSRLQAVDLALKHTFRSLSMEASRLQGLANPALQALMRHTDAQNLEAVRGVKMETQRLAAKLDNVRALLSRQVLSVAR